MPFYEYQCKSCGHTLEAMQKVNDPPLKKCPDCGKSQLARLMSAPVFRLKGGGWYETDFKGDQDKKKNLADRPDSDAAKDDKKSSSDSKVAEAKGGDSTAKDAAKPAEKAADKPAAGGGSAESKKPSGSGISTRGTASAPAKTHPPRGNTARAGSGRAAAPKAVKRPAVKAKRR